MTDFINRDTALFFRDIVEAAKSSAAEPVTSPVQPEVSRLEKDYTALLQLHDALREAYTKLLQQHDALREAYTKMLQHYNVGLFQREPF